MNKHKKDCTCYTCKPDFVREFDITEIKKEK